MKQLNEYLLPDVGKCFKSNKNNIISFKINVDNNDYEQVEINSDNIDIIGEYAFVDKLFAVKVSNKREMKTHLVHQLFSNDDQIAIMLNGDAEIINYMNEWRDYFSLIINKILTIKNEQG